MVISFFRSDFPSDTITAMIIMTIITNIKRTVPFPDYNIGNIILAILFGNIILQRKIIIENIKVNLLKRLLETFVLKMLTTTG